MLSWAPVKPYWNVVSLIYIVNQQPNGLSYWDLFDMISKRVSKVSWIKSTITNKFRLVNWVVKSTSNLTALAVKWVNIIDFHHTKGTINCTSSDYQINCWMNVDFPNVAWTVKVLRLLLWTMNSDFPSYVVMDIFQTSLEQMKILRIHMYICSPTQSVIQFHKTRDTYSSQNQGYNPKKWGLQPFKIESLESLNIGKLILYT